MQNHITNFGWHYKSRDKDLELSPFIEIATPTTDKPEKLWLEPGYPFNWQLSEGKTCSGYSKDGVYHACPFNNPPSSNFNTCAYCSKQIGFIDAFFLKKEPNQQMQNYLGKQHIIYLAFFQPNIVKVGTSPEYRRFIRTMEQDALVASFIASSDGHTIQTIEKAISKLGYPEGVNSKSKRAYMSSPPKFESASEMLFSRWQSIYSKLKDSEVGKYLTRFESEAGFLESTISHLENPNLFIPAVGKNIKIMHDPKFLAGNFKGIRGKYLLWENDQKLYAISKSDLVGRHFDYSEATEAYPTPKAPSLFD